MGRGPVTFPAFMAERVYMEEFTKQDGLPEHLSRWQDTVDAMLTGVDTDGPIYLMVDQAVVLQGDTHRRPGLHVDGYWNPGLSIHQRGHTSVPSHRSRPAHGPTPRHMSGSYSWQDADFKHPEGILLASNVTASRALVGTYTGVMGDMGDCSQINVEGLQAVPLIRDYVYAGNVSMLHESLPVAETCERTVVRLNVPGWTPQ